MRGDTRMRIQKCHRPRRDQMTAYLVRVDLANLAANLEGRDGERHSKSDAAQWLTRSFRVHDAARVTVFTDPSPFRPTDQFGVFYTAEDPAAWLYPDEILTVRPAAALPYLASGPVMVEEVAA